MNKPNRSLFQRLRSGRETIEDIVKSGIYRIEFTKENGKMG